MNNIEELFKNKDINEYFYNQLKKKELYFPEDILNSYLNEAKEMSNLNISSTEEQKIYFYISIHTPDIVKDLIDNIEQSKYLNDIIKIIYLNKDKYPIDNIENFYYAAAKAAQNVGLTLKESVLDNINMLEYKKAYPLGTSNTYINPIYNIEKWVSATKSIYEEGNKIGLSKAFDLITKNWNIMEKLNFKDFLNFYQSGDYNSYKVAQFHGKPQENYVLPSNFPNLKAKLPEPMPEKEVSKKTDINEARTKIEDQRNRIIGRLNSAEKLLYSLDGQFFAGSDQEEMLKMLQDLKRKVQTSNKMTIESSLFEDFIYRAGNLFKLNGKSKAANFFYKIAQEPGNANEELPPDFSMEEGGNPEQTMQDSGVAEKTEQAMQEFIKKIEKGVQDFDFDDFTKSAELIVNAQDSNVTKNINPGTSVAPKEINVKEEIVIDPDDAIDAALNNITINDVVRRLEILSSFFKKREVAKQLAIVDLMMDRLGIGSFFPSLGEATRSALESNSYASTRIEDILSKLQGSLKSNDAEQIFNNEPSPVAPEVAGIAKNLEMKQEEDEKRRELRKQREMQKNEKDLEKPEQAQELSQPTNVEPQQPLINR